MALETNTNRLNLPNMVHRQIQQENPLTIAETYFNPLILTGKRKIIENKEPRQAEISTSFNSIIASVHNKLKSTQQVYQKVRKLEESKSIVVEEPTVECGITAKTLTTPNEKEKSDVNEAKTVKKVNTIQKSASPPKTISIPQIKANRANKQLQQMRRYTPKLPDYGNPTCQQRINEVREQKKILEDMLMQHQRLQRDRQSIAMEIQSMREHLSDIRHKLDLSFKRLTTKPIAYNEVLLKPKVFTRPLQWRNSFMKKPPISSVKLPQPHSILKVSNAKAAVATPKSTNQQKLKSANPIQNKKNAAIRTTSASRNKKALNG